MSSSWRTISEGEENIYLDKIKKYVSSKDFSNFRADHEWQIWESGEKKVGEISLEYLKNRNYLKYFFEFESLFKLNDLIGNPKLNDFLEVKSISSSTIQYAADAITIKQSLNGSEVKTIIEIGAGFGGLCRAISALINFEKYVIVDLPEVLLLQQKFLKFFPDIFEKVVFISALDEKEIKNLSRFDLAISCASIAELDEPSQLLYNSRVLEKANYVYLSYNSLHVPGSKKIFYKLYKTWIQAFSIKTWEGLQGVYFFMEKNNKFLKRVIFNIKNNTTLLQFSLIRNLKQVKNSIKVFIKNSSSS